jgi:hypothetical protein
VVLHEPDVGPAGPHVSPARGAAEGGPVTAVLDALSSGERHADRLALACADALTRRGGAGVLVTTQPAVLGDLRHVALVVAVDGLGADEVGEVLAAVARADADGRRGLLVAGHVSGDPELEPVLRAVLAAHRTGNSGRAVVFPGQADVPATTTVGTLLAGTATAEVRVLGGPEPEPGTPLHTRGFLRPRWVEGRLVLHVQPAVGGVLVPFETPDPTPCCAAHA